MQKTILLVEDNPNDEMLTIRALKKNNILNEVIVARDGKQALDYLFAEGEHEGRVISRRSSCSILNCPRSMAMKYSDGSSLMNGLNCYPSSC